MAERTTLVITYEEDVAARADQVVALRALSREIEQRTLLRVSRARSL
jgi:hypothetical protein